MSIMFGPRVGSFLLAEQCYSSNPIEKTCINQSEQEIQLPVLYQWIPVSSRTSWFSDSQAFAGLPTAVPDPNYSLNHHHHHHPQLLVTYFPIWSLSLSQLGLYIPTPGYTLSTSCSQFWSHIHAPTPGCLPRPSCVPLPSSSKMGLQQQMSLRARKIRDINTWSARCTMKGMVGSRAN